MQPHEFKFTLQIVGNAGKNASVAQPVIPTHPHPSKILDSNSLNFICESANSPQLTTVIEPRIMVVRYCGHKLRHHMTRPDFFFFYICCSGRSVNTTIVKRIHFPQWALLPATRSKHKKPKKNPNPVIYHDHMTTG